MRADGTVDCLSVAHAQASALEAEIGQAWRAGDYGAVNIGVGLYAANSVLGAIGLAENVVIAAPYNAGWNTVRGFSEGDYEKALVGSAELASLGVAAYFGQLLKAAQLARHPLSGLGPPKGTELGSVAPSGATASPVPTAAGGAAEAVKVGDYALTRTVAGKLAERPYLNSPLTLREIMAPASRSRIPEASPEHCAGTCQERSAALRELGS